MDDDNINFNAFEAVDAETDAIMKGGGCVSESARIAYERRNIAFFMWLFDNREHHSDLIEGTMLPALEAAAQADRKSRTTQGKLSKARKALRAECRDKFRSINPSVESTHPIKLGEMQFHIFARYLATFKKSAQRRTLDEDCEVAAESSVTLRLGMSSFEGACSALAHLYNECGLDREVVSKELWSKVYSYKKGLKQVGVKRKKELGVTQTRGKRALPFPAYLLLAKILFESEKPDHVPAHTFLILEWNLVSGGKNVVNSKLDHMSFVDDTLLFDMGASNTDQERVCNTGHPWHCYSNPEHPEICSHLAVARYTMANPVVLNGQCNLFEGSSQYERFNGIFCKIINGPAWSDQFSSLGMPPQSFGSDSIRKGAAMHVATGSTFSPPIASICIRANWSMPGDMGQEIKYDNAGDQLVGKCASGRSRHDKSFAISSAYFDFSGCDEKESKERRLHSWLRDQLPQGTKGNRKVFSLLKMCVASIVYNNDFLESHVHPESVIRLSPLWTDDVPFREHVVARCPWNATPETPAITGLPREIVLLAKLEALQASLTSTKEELRASFKSDLREELDSREIGGPGSHTNGLAAKLDSMMAKMEGLSASVQIAQTPKNNVPRSPDESYVSEAKNGFVSDEEDVLIESDEPCPRKRAKLVRERTREQLKKRTIKVGYHHGRLNPLPSSWRLPRGMTVIQLANLWLVGSEKEGVPPLRMLQAGDVGHIDEKRRRFHKMKALMRIVEKFGRQEGVWPPPGGWSSGTVTSLWSAIWPHLEPYLRTESQTAKGISHEKSRLGQISHGTLYNKMQRKGLFNPNFGVEPRDITGISSKIPLLDDEGFRRASCGEKDWNKRLEELREFRREHGHCDVPGNHHGGLGKWVQHQRDEFRGAKTSLDARRVRLLVDLGFKWGLAPPPPGGQAPSTAGHKVTAARDRLALPGSGTIPDTAAPAAPQPHQQRPSQQQQRRAWPSSAAPTSAAAMRQPISAAATAEDTPAGKQKSWQQDEKERFLKGLLLYGWGQWYRIQAVVRTRTNSQIRSHALEREKANPEIRIKYARRENRRSWAP